MAICSGFSTHTILFSIRAICLVSFFFLFFFLLKPASNFCLNPNPIFRKKVMEPDSWHPWLYSWKERNLDVSNWKWLQRQMSVFLYLFHLLFTSWCLVSLYLCVLSSTWNFTINLHRSHIFFYCVLSTWTLSFFWPGTAPRLINIVE